jgi:hypothetical protein
MRLWLNRNAQNAAVQKYGMKTATSAMVRALSLMKIMKMRNAKTAIARDLSKALVNALLVAISMMNIDLITRTNT